MNLSALIENNLKQKHERAARLLRNKRQDGVQVFSLLELDPSTLIDEAGSRKAYLTGEISTSGEMREICPECQDVHLSLVLRQKYVRRSHMFCKQCNRCFDACFPDGSSALSLGEMSIESNQANPVNNAAAYSRTSTLIF